MSHDIFLSPNTGQVFNVITHCKSNLKSNFILTTQRNNFRILTRGKYEINKYFKNTFTKAIKYL